MPYIPHEDRLRAMTEPRTPGELNFAITRLLMTYIEFKTVSLTGHSSVRYSDLNDCLGALEGAKLEFYRRVVVPIEDIKREQNGDVYGEDPPEAPVCGWCKDPFNETGTWHPAVGPVHIRCFHQMRASPAPSNPD